jgi:hypothetical protein
MFYVLEGLDQGAMAEEHACAWSSVSTVRLCLDRSSRLSSLTRRGRQFESNFEPLALPLDCSQSAVEIGLI